MTDVALEAFNAVNPMPFTIKVPGVIFDEFKWVNEEPDPTTLVADKVLVVLFH